MRKFCFAILLACPLFAQLDTDTVTITATRTMTVRPDLAQFSATVQTNLDGSQEDAIAMLAPFGVQASDLMDVSERSNQLTWSFAWSVPIAKVGDTAAALAAAHIQFSLGTRVSDAVLAPSNCPAADLLGDAQNQARMVATVANATLGPMLTLSNVTVTTPTSILVGDFFPGPVIPVLRVLPSLPASSQLTCTLTAKFRLNR